MNEEEIEWAIATERKSWVYNALGRGPGYVWIDHENEIIIVLLTNRVHPTRETKGMYSIRRNFHTEVMKAIL